MNKGETKLSDEQLPKGYFDKKEPFEGFIYSVYHDDNMWEYNNPRIQ